MYKKTEEKAAQILNLFKEGKLLFEICETTVSSPLTAKKVLRSFGIDYNEFLKQDYQRRLNLVPVLYEQGKSQTYMEQNLKLTRKTIRNILKSNVDVKYKTKSEQWRLRWGYTLDEHCFDDLTNNCSYWIGFLYADGHVRQLGKEVSIEVTVHLQDIQLLEKFKLFLNCDKKVELSKREESCRLRIYSKIIYDKLRSLGFNNDKSYTATPHGYLKHSRDFWRGVVDGDGGVYNREDTPAVYLCGTLETVFDFIIFNTEFANVKDKYPTKCQKSKSLYQVQYYGQDAIKIATILYEGSETYLDRKYQKFLEIKQRETKNQPI